MNIIKEHWPFKKAPTLFKPDEKLSEHDLFFITYDEPAPEKSWQQIQKNYSHAKRVDKVKGFDKAHKTCACLTTKDRFVTIDGDNELYFSLFSQEIIPYDLLKTNYILSWSAKNSINGLAYGNGGVKCWPTHIVHNMRSHEEATEEKSAVDFCFQLQYYQMPGTLTISNIHHTPYQAFRSGFREGVKFGLIKGEKVRQKGLPQIANKLMKHMANNNKERLRIWGSVGEDVDNGLWSIYGTRLGIYCLYVEQIDLNLIRDYDWFNHYWQTVIGPRFNVQQHTTQELKYSWDNKKLKSESHQLMKELNEKLALGFCELSKEQSQFFKNNYRNPLRQGLM